MCVLVTFITLVKFVQMMRNRAQPGGVILAEGLPGKNAAQTTVDNPAAHFPCLITAPKIIDNQFISKGDSEK